MTVFDIMGVAFCGVGILGLGVLITLLTVREILFRGKTKHGEWVEGWFVGKTRKAPYDPPKEKTAIISEDLYCYDVIPETVGQYTGVTDANGKKIFEGDIVRRFVNEKELRGVVEYADGAFGVRFTDGAGQFICFFENGEIIGNIHQPRIINK